ncbi:hypothetical protein Vafri_9279, partial [Volvox africanus]
MTVHKSPPHLPYFIAGAAKAVPHPFLTPPSRPLVRAYLLNLPCQPPLVAGRPLLLPSLPPHLAASQRLPYRTALSLQSYIQGVLPYVYRFLRACRHLHA